MSLLTNWGYLIDQNVTELPDMLSQTAFGDMTAGKYSGDVRIPSMICTCMRFASRSVDRINCRTAGII